MPESDSNSSSSGLTGKIALWAGCIVTAGAVYNAIDIIVNRTESWTCNIGVLFSWCQPASSAETWSEEVGGKGGTPFGSVMCRASETLVGFYGRVGTGPVIFSIGPICATAQFNWKYQVTSISQTVRRGDEAGSNQGDPFELTCPSNMVAIGFDLGSAIISTNFGPQEYLVVPLSLRCSGALTFDNPSWTAITGTGERPYNTSRRPFLCPVGNAACGIKGRAGQFIDAISLGCRRVYGGIW